VTNFDFRDAVEQGCDAFAPERREAIPLGRGATFVEFLDINRAKVRVALSSAAMRECCRVFIEPHDVDRVQIVTPSGIVHPAKADADLHLCRCMASALWCALNEAYGNTLDTQRYCESSGRIGPEATAVLHNDLTAERDQAVADAERMRLCAAIEGHGVDPNGYYAGTPGDRLRDLERAEAERDRAMKVVTKLGEFLSWYRDKMGVEIDHTHPLRAVAEEYDRTTPTKPRTREEK
jgi:hypothetical protein